MKKLIFIRGIPGSGKSTFAEELRKSYVQAGKTVSILTTDDFFVKCGSYEYNIEFIGEAHAWNRGRFAFQVFRECDIIIIPNTNIEHKQITGYLPLAVKMGYEIEVLYPPTSWANDSEECSKKNVHNVPFEVIERMRSKFESHEVFMNGIWEYIKGIKQ